MNCWEFHDCMHIPDKGPEACPAWPRHGKTCARVTNTLSGRTARGAFSVKLGRCMKCDFYNSPFYDREKTNTGAHTRT